MYKDIWIKSQFLQDLMKIAVRLFLTKVGNNENIAPSLNIFKKKSISLACTKIIAKSFTRKLSNVLSYHLNFFKHLN